MGKGLPSVALQLPSSGFVDSYRLPSAVCGSENSPISFLTPAGFWTKPTFTDREVTSRPCRDFDF